VTTSKSEITALLGAWTEGDEEALGKLTPLVYRELYRSARRHMARENPGHTLQPTALINEVYLRLGKLQQLDWHDRAHFYAVCARLMRRVLIDYARSRINWKRSSQAPEMLLLERPTSIEKHQIDFVALNEALDRLAALDERMSQVVELRFFGGLSVEETAEVMELSGKTVKRSWKLAKVWLLRELGRVENNDQ
jgi:RNA polymerase sigma-70 factor, ECF subfamily